jgi:outer membrane receptor protein involved in Fe transport
MRMRSAGLPACLLFFSAALSAAQIQGKVVDPSGAPVAGARIAAWSRTGVGAQTSAAADGSFELEAPPEAKLVVMSPGFRTATVEPAQAAIVRLEIAPVIDSVQVAGSSIDAPLEQQGGSASLIPAEELRSRNEPYAADLLRYLPGVSFDQTGAAGGVDSLFLRGGNSNFGLVQIDGVPVNSFGGAFDFAHIPSTAIDHIEVIRGPQSAVYGSYANSGAINFVTRQPSSSPDLEVVAEGGSYGERRFGLTASDTLAGFGLIASASRIDTNGPVTNSDYRNEDLLLNVTRRFRRQSLSLHGDFDSNEAGEPGPWGSDPAHTFTGIDTISREKNNFGDYGAHWEADLSPRVRQEASGSFFLENAGFQSPYGPSFNQDRRFQGDALTVVSVTSHYTAAFGVTAGREDVKNSFITDADFATFPIERKDAAVYQENRFEIGGRLFLNAGVRVEWIRTPAIPGDGYTRPDFPANNLARVNPKLAAAYVLDPATRVHTSFGTGIRPPTGFELAFTDNPRLAPERTRSFDAGLERRLFHDLLVLDGTYFYNRYYDLIVTLGGSLATLSHYTTANLANSRAEGGEFTAGLRPARWVFLRGSYTLLETRILSLDGSSQAPLPFTVGQPLTRRPEHSGNFVATFSRKRITADLTGYFRGKTLYEEPTLGASNGLFWDPGFANVGFNLNYDLGGGMTLYGNLRNALDQHYEEVFGYPSPRLNFVAGMKWTLSRRR